MDEHRRAPVVQVLGIGSQHGNDAAMRLYRNWDFRPVGTLLIRHGSPVAGA